MVMAYSYSRFSSRAQAEGDSLRRQLSAAFAYAEANDLTLDTSLQDHGVSAFTGANRLKGALGSFLDRVKSGEIEQGSYLLIDSMDRLSRQDVTQATHQLLGIALEGISVVTLNDGRKFDRNASMADVMMAVIEIERSHRESAEKGRKVAAAHGESKRKAREEGRVWHRSGPTRVKFNDVTRRFEIIPHKVEAVHRIYNLIEDGMGTTAIAVRFNDEGVETPRGLIGKWHHSAVLEVAKNAAVIGIYQPKLATGGNRASRRPADGEPIEGYYPAIIDREQFYRVQSIIKGRAPKRGRGNNSTEFANLLTGLCRCNGCGGTVGLHTASKHTKWKRTSALSCVDARRGLCTSKHRYPYEPIEQAIIRHVVEFVPPDTAKGDVLASKITALTAERDEIAEKVENLLQLLETGDAGLLDRYRDRKGQLAAKEAEIAELRERRNASLSATVPYKTRQEAMQRLLDQMAAAEGAELYRLRAGISAALKGVVAGIEFHEEEVYGFAGARQGETFNTHYLLVHMVDDENAYLIDAHSVSVWPKDGEVRKLWSDLDEGCLKAS